MNPHRLLALVVVTLFFLNIMINHDPINAALVGFFLGGVFGLYLIKELDT